DPQKTALRFVPNPFGKGRLYRTGDRVRLLPDGTLEYLGRLDHQVKIRGFRVELGEIEALLSSHSSVSSCVVLSLSLSLLDQRLVAYVVPHPGSSRSSSSLREFLSAKLPEYMVPSSFLFLDSLPLTRNGKVDRGALALLQAEDDDQVVAP